jgi:hypothetical protein
MKCEKMKAVYSSCFTLGCLLVFVLIVTCLQTVQKGYDWHAQFISELALGEQGGMMQGAFMALALSCASFARSLHALFYRCQPMLASALAALCAIAAISFPCAGFVTLRDHATGHIIFVAFAFMAITLTIFIVLRASPCFALRVGAALAVFIIIAALLLTGLQAGESQRLAAIGVLGWMAFVEVFLLFREKRDGNR